MSLTRTNPTIQPATIPSSEAAGTEGWREFDDADARRDAIRGDLALDLAADLATAPHGAEW